MLHSFSFLNDSGVGVLFSLYGLVAARSGVFFILCPVRCHNAILSGFCLPCDHLVEGRETCLLCFSLVCGICTVLVCCDHLVGGRETCLLCFSLLCGICTVLLCCDYLVGGRETCLLCFSLLCGICTVLVCCDHLVRGRESCLLCFPLVCGICTVLVCYVWSPRLGKRELHALLSFGLWNMYCLGVLRMITSLGEERAACFAFLWFVEYVLSWCVTYDHLVGGRESCMLCFPLVCGICTVLVCYVWSPRWGKRELHALLSFGLWNMYCHRLLALPLGSLIGFVPSSRKHANFVWPPLTLLYILKLGFTAVYTIFLIFSSKT